MEIGRDSERTRKVGEESMDRIWENENRGGVVVLK